MQYFTINQLNCVVKRVCACCFSAALVSYHREGTRPHSDRAMVEQSTDNPLGTMCSLVAHHLQDLVHGCFTIIVHVVNAGAVGQQQVRHVWVYVLTGHVQRRVSVLVHSLDISPRQQQRPAHSEVPLKLLRLLRLRTRRVQGREALVVAFVHVGSVAQVELDVAREPVPGCDV